MAKGYDKKSVKELSVASLQSELTRATGKRKVQIINELTKRGV